MINEKFKEIINTDNKKRIFRNILRNGTSSRVELAKELNLTTASLSKITKQLLDEGLLEENGEITEGKIGRKQIELHLARNTFFSIGIDISSNFSRFIIMDLALNEIYERSWEYDYLSQQHLDLILEDLKFSLTNIDDNKILGVGLLLQGIIENDYSISLPIKDIKKQIENKLNKKILILNNIKGLAIVENLFDGNKDNYLLIKYGPGIGGVLSVAGKVIEGSRNRAGEIGHIHWNSDSDIKCPVCGKYGCLESQIHLNRIFKKKYKSVIKSPDEINMKFIKENRKELIEYVKELGKAISIAIDLVDPSQILIAGSVFDDDEIYEKLKDSIVETTKSYSYDNIYKIENYEEKTRIASAMIVLQYYLV